MLGIEFVQEGEAASAVESDNISATRPSRPVRRWSKQCAGLTLLLSPLPPQTQGKKLSGEDTENIIKQAKEAAAMRAAIEVVETL